MFWVKLAKIVTLGLCVWLVWFLFDEGIDYFDLEDWLILSAMAFGLILNWLALSSKGSGGNLIDLDIWPFLLIKRLTLQEKKKINDLEKK